MAILAFDTTTDFCSVACLSKAQLTTLTKQTRSGKGSPADTSMSAVLIPMLQECLSNNGLTMAAVETLMLPRGPGSFTGIRIGFSVMHGLVIAKNYKVYAPTLFDVWAHTYSTSKILMLMDNKQGKFYAAEASKGTVNYGTAGIMSYEEVEQLSNSYEFILCDQVTDGFIRPEKSTAEQLVNMAQTIDMSAYQEITPYYLHNPAFRKLDDSNLSA